MKAISKPKHPLAVTLLFFFFLITGILTCGGEDMCVYATTLSGSGIQDDPYIINNSEDLWTFAELVTSSTTKNECAKVADGVTEIDTTIRGEQINQKWKPICTSIYSNLYTGVFDGNGATIKIDADRAQSYDDNSGLFGVLGDGGEIRNVTTAGSSKANKYAGGICGTLYSETAKIVNCHNTATITATQNGAGGLVGQLYKGQILSDSTLSNSGTVTAESQAGGLVGYVGSDSSIIVSGSIINTGAVTATTGGQAGGLIGDGGSNTFSIYADDDILNTGEITAKGSDAAGGLIGKSTGTLSIISYQGMLKNSGIVTSDNHAGGIAGTLVSYNSCTIQADKGIQNTAAITGGTKYQGSFVGGVFGDYSSSALLSTPNGCIQNIGTVTCSATGSYVGGVMGRYNSGQTASKLSNSGAVSGTGSYTGGIIGLWSDTTSGLSDACNTGEVTSSDSSTTALGAIVGCFQGTSVTDVYHMNDLPCLGDDKKSGSITNCYCLDTNTQAMECETKKTAVEFKNGALAYLLDGTGESRNQTLLWGQKIGTDNAPVLCGDTVYLNGSTYSNTTQQPSFVPSTDSGSSSSQTSEAVDKTEQTKDTDSSDSSDAALAAGEVIKNEADGAAYVAKETKDGSLELAIKKPENKKQTKIVIPDTVAVGGISIAVTSIEKNAFKDNKKLTKVTIGENIKAIGAGAFKGCTKLKTIKIKSTGLTAKTLSKNAFKGIPAQTTIKVPKEKLAAYKKLFRSKGLSSKVKIIGY